MQSLLDRRSFCGLVAAALGYAAAARTARGTAGEAADSIIGRLEYHRVREPDTLLDIARLHDLGFIELVAANPGIDPWVPGEGRTLILPKMHLLPNAPREGIVINLPELRLYYFGDGTGPVVTYPIGVGRIGWETPTGVTRIVRKREAPTWTPPASIRLLRPWLPATVPPGPGNPLGDYALDLGWKNYVLHGTNRPYGIGRRVSSGCIRLYPEDIERLFAAVSVGTPVTVVAQPLKLGWSEGELFIEVHPDALEGDQLERRGWFSPTPLPQFEERIHSFAGAQAHRIDWSAARAIARGKRGIPVQITF